MHIRFLQPYGGLSAGDEVTATTEYAIELIERGIAEPIAGRTGVGGKRMDRPPADKSMSGRRVENK